jgi:hypothetical protein
MLSTVNMQCNALKAGPHPTDYIKQLFLRAVL